MEESHLDTIPDGEAEEIRQIFQQKGFDGDLLDRVVEVITADRKLWVETMLREEWGLSLVSVSPLKAALVTFTAFAGNKLPITSIRRIPNMESSREA